MINIAGLGTSWKSYPSWNLFWATIALLLSFMFWSFLSSLAPRIRGDLNLKHSEIGILLTLPLFLGSIGRIPIGWCADRWGGRAVVKAIFFAGSMPFFLLAFEYSHRTLLFFALAIGVFGTVFSAGAAFVNDWFSPQRKGRALGIYALGNLGVGFGIWQNTWDLDEISSPRVLFASVGTLSIVFGILFFKLTTDCTTPSRPPMTVPPAIDGRALLLSFFYFVSFGSFLALSMLLPLILSEATPWESSTIALTASGFALITTFGRTLGGWMADSLAPKRIILFSYFASAVSAAIASSHIEFGGSILASGFLWGICNGTIFKLIPQHFPHSTGSISGTVSAFGCIGGFALASIVTYGSHYLGNYDHSISIFTIAALAAGILSWVFRGRL